MAAETDSLEQHADEIAGLRGQVSMLDEYISTGQIVATTTAAAPTLIVTDTWHDTGAMTGTGWGKGSGYFKYRLLPDGTVMVAAKDLTIAGGAAVADGTTILSAANGLPAAYAPVTNKIIPAYSDVLKVNGGAFEAAAFKFVNDGSVQCLGFSTAATTADCYAVFPVDI